MTRDLGMVRMTGMEINLTLSILAAACGGFLLGWQLRTDLLERRRRRDARAQRGETGAGQDVSPRGPAIHTPPRQRRAEERVT